MGGNIEPFEDLDLERFCFFSLIRLSIASLQFFGLIILSTILWLPCKSQLFQLFLQARPLEQKWVWI
jgi:hypothetical protein